MVWSRRWIAHPQERRVVDALPIGAGGIRRVDQGGQRRQQIDVRDEGVAPLASGKSRELEKTSGTRSDTQYATR